MFSLSLEVQQPAKARHKTVTASGSAEADFIVVFTAAKAAQHLRFVLQELEFPQEAPTEIHFDDQAALQTINDNQAPSSV